MMLIVDKTRASGNESKVFPVVESFEESHIFYKDSYAFKQAHKKIKFAPGFKCSQCENKSRHNSQSGYCFLHKRIVDMGETCVHNTRSEYRNVNTVVCRVPLHQPKPLYTPISEW